MTESQFRLFFRIVIPCLWPVIIALEALHYLRDSEFNAFYTFVVAPIALTIAVIVCELHLKLFFYALRPRGCLEDEQPDDSDEDHTGNEG